MNTEAPTTEQQEVRAADIQRIAEGLAQAFNPERIVLFGSRALGTHRRDSDIDLLVIVRRDDQTNPTQYNPGQTDQLIEQTLGFRFPADVIVMDTDRCARGYLEYDPLVRPALDHGQVLYVKSPLSITVRQWVDKAQEDWRWARNARDANPPSSDMACFMSQQCAEKLMKAVLIHHGITPEKTHLLENLSRELVKVLENYTWPEAELRELSRASVRYRYPDRNYPHLTPEEALDLCGRIREQLLPRLGVGPGDESVNDR